MGVFVSTVQRDRYAGRDRLALTTRTSLSRAFLGEEHPRCPTAQRAGACAHVRVGTRRGGEIRLVDLPCVPASHRSRTVSLHRHWRVCSRAL